MIIEGVTLTAKTLSKEKIIIAASDLLAQDQTVTATKLGKILQTRPQAIYNYFSDINAIKIAVATKFCQNLAIRLEADLREESGLAAIRIFANTVVHYSLDNRQLWKLTIALDLKNGDQALIISLDQLSDILWKILSSLIASEFERLGVSRLIRDLIIGEITQSNNGYLDNKKMSQHDSFDLAMKIVLSHLDEQNN